MPAQEASSRPARPVSPRRQQRQQDEQIQMMTLQPKPGPQLGSTHPMLGQASPRSLAAQAQLWQAESEQDAEAYGELLTLLRRSQCGMRAESLLERLLHELCELRAESMTYGAQNQSLLVGIWHAHTTIALATSTAQLCVQVLQHCVTNTGVHLYSGLCMCALSLRVELTTRCRACLLAGAVRGPAAAPREAV